MNLDITHSLASRCPNFEPPAGPSVLAALQRDCLPPLITHLNAHKINNFLPGNTIHTPTELHAPVWTVRTLAPQLPG